ncbi:MAG: zinc metalloprotease HtpX [Minisyncoccota bacterium]
MSTFLIVVIGLGWIFSYLYESQIILVGAIVFALLMNVASYWYSDKIVLSLHKAKPVTRESHFDIYNSLENLSITAGLPMPRFYIVDDPSPNAFATGRNKEHAVICVTTGLLQILDKNEIEGVLAHELSHVGNRDILISTVAVVLAGFIALLSDFFLRSTIFGGRDNKGNGMLMIVGIVLAILAPIAATVIQLAISRKREFLADASGALLTRYPQGLASALKKISGSASPLKTAHTATAHLFIANPFGGRHGARSAFRKMFMTHPPVEDRVRALVGSDNI